MDGKQSKPGFVLLTASMLLVLVGNAFAFSPSLSPRADPDNPPGPDRFASIFMDYTLYHWWMAAFEDNSLVCEIDIEHEGPPTWDEVYIDCGEDIYNTWVEQEPCTGTKANTCEGYYLYQVGSAPAQKEIAVALPPALAWVSLEDCEPLSTTSTNICERFPKLVLIGEEPLPNEEIIGIAGRVDGEPFKCDSPCRLRLAPTDEDGVAVEFWAYSSYGDSSQIFTAQVRVAESNEGNPDQIYWYVDVLSSQWTGVPVASCAESWDSFPPVGGPPAWLTTPKRIEDLITEVSYNYLAANLIKSGLVNASTCENGGLLDDDYGANTCGQEIAQPAVTEWQNHFDSLILEVAKETGIPAQMLKNLFARESQFWPGLLESSDIGLGQLTEDGADTTLLWNPSFYEQFCPLVLPKERCDKGYLHLDDDEKELLRLGLVSSVNAACTDCPLGIDLTRAEFSVRVFGHTLLANCEQTGRILRNVSGEAPGTVASYEDLWKFTLVNYNAGPGCLGEAIQFTYDMGQNLEWSSVAENLAGVCQAAVDYVEDISR